MTEDEVLTKLDAAGLGRYREQAMAVLQPAIAVHTLPERDETIVSGSSKMGGWPDLPHGTWWPGREKNGASLAQSFLTQINFAETHAVFPDLPLPSAGLLSVFYDTETQASQAGYAVLYTPADTPLERCSLRHFDDGEAPRVFNACRLNLVKGLSARAIGTLAVEDTEFDALQNLLETLGFTEMPFGMHQLLGAPATSIDDNIIDFVLDERGLSYDALLDEAQCADVESEAASWRLLLTIDSDPEAHKGKPGWIWGDGGALYLYIHEQHLAARDFSRVQLLLKSSWRFADQWLLATYRRGRD